MHPMSAQGVDAHGMPKPQPFLERRRVVIDASPGGRIRTPGKQERHRVPIVVRDGKVQGGVIVHTPLLDICAEIEKQLDSTASILVIGRECGEQGWKTRTRVIRISP